jgi:hypothetical protein
MKRIFSGFLGVFFLPVKLVRRIKISGFIAGTIFGAVFSLIVNIVTVQVQEYIQKQRILEAIENEIVTNMLQASDILTYNIDIQQNNKGINNFHTFKKYYRDLWEQSTEPLQYIAQLEQDPQIKLNTYYAVTIPYENLLQDKLNKMSDKLFDDCFDKYGKNVIKDNSDECNKEYYLLLELESRSTVKAIYDESIAVLKIFHPTTDRLKSPILRFLMGTKSMRILSGK